MQPRRAPYQRMNRNILVRSNVSPRAGSHLWREQECPSRSISEMFELGPRKDSPEWSMPEFVDPEDRGIARFFHGRERELKFFRSALDAARRSNGGTIFLVQGPPGAGKTALLHECKKQAEQAGWGVAYVSTLALADPQELAKNLNESYALGTTKYRETEGGVGVSVGVQGSVNHTRGTSVVYAGRTVDEIIEDIATPRGFVLIMDEAQDLRETGRRSAKVNDDLRLSMRRIHSGGFGKPVVLLVGGLGTTRSVLQTFGISRFRRRRIHQLGALSEDEAAAVIEDWLVQGAGAPKDHGHLGHWINSLAAECHGWPQHLQIYAQLAAGWVRANRGTLPPEVPEEVLEEAREDRLQYYFERADELMQPHRTVLANLLQLKGKNDTLTEDEVIDAFSTYQPRARAEKIFNVQLHKGVIAADAHGGYRVPIPSMYDWLVEGYADAAPTLPPATPSEDTQAGRSADRDLTRN